jgi:hypothetical protein
MITLRYYMTRGAILGSGRPDAVGDDVNIRLNPFYHHHFRFARLNYIEQTNPTKPDHT